jgi:Stigma-specific protein, Stig1
MKKATRAGLRLCGVLAAAMGCGSVDDAGLGAAPPARTSPVNPERTPDAALADGARAAIDARPTDSSDGRSDAHADARPTDSSDGRIDADARADARACPVPLSDCRDPDSRGPAVCVNLADDEENCGGCGEACPAGAACTMGGCACSPGATVCAGTCVDLEGDARNCGACRRACAAGQVCVAGTCLVTCQEGQTVCDGTCVNLRSDSDNCGACGHDCKGKRECVAGECVRSRG